MSTNTRYDRITKSSTTNRKSEANANARLTLAHALTTDFQLGYIECERMHTVKCANSTIVLVRVGFSVLIFIRLHWCLYWLRYGDACRLWVLRMCVCVFVCTVQPWTCACCWLRSSFIIFVSIESKRLEFEFLLETRTKKKMHEMILRPTDIQNKTKPNLLKL